MRKLSLAILPLLCVLALPALSAPDTDLSVRGGNGNNGPASVFNVAVPDHPFDLILARPESESVTLSVLAYRDMHGSVAFGTRPGALTEQTKDRSFQKGAPTDLVLGPLKANTRYYYQFRSFSSGTEHVTATPTSSFHTARPPGSTFTFTLTADSHLDEHTSPAVYLQTLSNIRADDPDFNIDLGNLFMTDKQASRADAAKQYLAQRYYLGQIGAFVPILLALGTHDAESGRYNDGSSDCLAVWSNTIRKSYFPNPVPDGFFSGNSTKAPQGDLLQDYYAWQWGDALFVVLDPFWYSTQQANDGWGWSLGTVQYQWLEETLERSRAKFKFVFVHNLLSGNNAARGGVEVAGFNEWGGKNADGSDGFQEHRQGWDMPVHALLIRSHVTAVFKAHDNFYAKQDLDGIVYQMVPQPSFAGNDRIRDLGTYGYKHGTFIGNSGHVRVTVSPDQVTVAYVRSIQPDQAGGIHGNAEIASSYSIKPD